MLAIVAAADLLAAPFVIRRMRRAAGSWRLAGWLVAAMAVEGAALGAVFRLLGLSLERDTTVLWALAGVSVAVTCFVAARAMRRLPKLEISVALVVVIEGAAVLAAATGSHTMASAEGRALLVAPAALFLAAFFGASLGHLLTAGAGGLRPGYEGFIARRFLLSKGSPVLSAVTTISMIGVTLGVWLVIVSLAILSGFENDLAQKIIGATAPLVIEKQQSAPMELTSDQAAAIAGTPGVVAQSPVIEGEAAVSSSSNYTGGLVFGVEPARATEVLGLLGKVTDGSLAPIEAELRPAPAPAADGGEFPPPAALPHVAIGIEMAKGLNVGVGDHVRVISPILETMTPVGPTPKSATFEVAAIFSSKMYEYDARYAFVSLPAARRFFELGAGEVSAVQVAVRDPDRADDVGRAVVAKLGDGFEAHDWKERNQTLFSALKLERVVAFIVLVFIILVATFAIVNTLTMSILEKKKEIAILKTMGARDGGVMKLFLGQGLIVGAFGTLVGTIAAVVTVGLLERFGFSIPGDVYYIDSLPVHMEPLDVVTVVLAAFLIVWDFAVIPALRGSRLSPVEGLRDA